jgi:hypothetical protein
MQTKSYSGHEEYTKHYILGVKNTNEILGNGE